MEERKSQSNFKRNLFFSKFFILFWLRGLFGVFAGLGKRIGETSVFGFVLWPFFGGVDGEGMIRGFQSIGRPLAMA